MCTSLENCHLVTLAVWERRSRMRVRSMFVRWMWRCQRDEAFRKALSSKSMRMTLTGLNRWADSFVGFRCWAQSFMYLWVLVASSLSWFLFLQMEDSEGTVRQIGAFSEGIQNLTVRLRALNHIRHPASLMLSDVLLSSSLPFIRACWKMMSCSRRLRILQIPA